MIRIDGFLLDCVTSETPVYEAEITTHPVEKGSNVTDNARVKPVGLMIEGIVSDTPLGVVALEADRQGNATPSVTGYQKLVQIQSTKKLVQIVSDKYGVFDDMFLTSFSAPFTKDTGKSLMFTARFDKFVIVDNNRTAVRTAVGNQGSQNPLGAKQAAQVFPNRVYVISVPQGPFARLQYGKLYSGAPFWTNANIDYYRVNYAGGQHADGFLTPTQTANGNSYVYTSLQNEWSQSSGTWKPPGSNNAVTQSPGLLGGNDAWNNMVKGLNS